ERHAESHPWRGNVFEREPELTEQVLREIRERGPLGSRHFDGSGPGGMWNWKPAKIVLEALHSAGRLVIAGRENFQRLYDEPERVYGYYVLPLLRRDRLVGRVDLKHDRSDGALRVKAFHREPGVLGALDDCLDAALTRLARVVGAETFARS